MRGLSPRERLLVSFVFAAVIVTVFYLFIWAPATTEQARLRTDLTNKQAELSRLKSLAATREAKEQEYAALVERIRLLEVRLPAEREIPRLIRQLQDAAKEIGIKLTLIRPGALQAGAASTAPAGAPRPAPAAGQPAQPAAPAEPRYRQFRLDLAFDGTYGDLMAYLGRLENFPRFLVLTQVGISPGTAPPVLKVTLAANTFVLPRDRPASTP